MNGNKKADKGYDNKKTDKVDRENFICNRDFVEKEGKFYAVLSTIPLLCSLRYVRRGEKIEKISGETIIEIIDNVDDVKIFRGRERLKEIIKHPQDIYEQDVHDLAEFLLNFIDVKNLGISGSGLIKCYRNDSDIDFVVYGAKNFDIARDAVKRAILNNGIVKELNMEQWKELYKKRIFGNELTFDEFLWHEKRKFNKGTINGRKFDLLVSDNVKINLNFKKTGSVKKTGRVVKANPFSYPAYYEILDDITHEITKILCWTHTYVGQAFEGENVEVCGMLEEINNGTDSNNNGTDSNETDYEKFIIVGTSRKAIGEYIKVIR